MTNYEACYNQGPVLLYAYKIKDKNNGIHSDKIKINRSFTTIYCELGNLQLRTSKITRIKDFKSIKKKENSLIKDLGFVFNSQTECYEKSGFPYRNIHT